MAMTAPTESLHRPKQGLQLAPSHGAHSPQLSPISPLSPPSPSQHFQLPSPLITRRNRTFSACERAASNPTETGVIKYFCRHKGHGFIERRIGGDDLFVHVSDVEGEYVPKEGDEVSFKVSLVPPKNEKHQAVHVQILNMAPEAHERWDAPSPAGAAPSSPSFLN